MILGWDRKKKRIREERTKSNTKILSLMFPPQFFSHFTRATRACSSSAKQEAEERQKQKSPFCSLLLLPGARGREKTSEGSAASPPPSIGSVAK